MTERGTDPVDPAIQVQNDVWRHVELSRNVNRPHTLGLLKLMAQPRSIIELHGDRTYGDDPAMVGGFATIGDHRVVFVGHQKGDDAYEMGERNSGMAKPEGYRKAQRLFELAERFGMPVVTFIDTAGADPGAESESRGIALAIAESMAMMSALRTPIVATIIGEGGSGGALGIGVGDSVIALENSTYSVISPEGCAQILWRAVEAKKAAAVAMKITAGDQKELGVVDEVVLEPDGGAHLDHEETARRLKASIVSELDRLTRVPLDNLVESRYDRYRRMGQFIDAAAPKPEIPRKKTLLDRLPHRKKK